MTPTNDNSDKLVYLKLLLVLKMMNADGKRGSSRAEEPVQLSGLLRTVPTLSHESVNPLALNAKAALDKSITTAATQCDDPWLIFLEKQYLLKLCFLSIVNPFYAIVNPFALFTEIRMASKKKPTPPPLAWSLLKIQEKQLKVSRRTKARLEELMATVPRGPPESNNKGLVFVIVILAISFGFLLATSSGCACTCTSASSNL